MLMDVALQSDKSASARELVAEANHRIANSLTVIAGLVRLHSESLCADRHSMDVAEVRLILNDVMSRIEAVGRLHRLLADAPTGGAIDLGTYLREIANALASTLTVAAKMSIHYSLQPGCRVPPERALFIGLMVGELVTNALKYAHPTGVAGRIAVSCENVGGDTVVIEVSDDGVGLPEGFDPAAGGNLGMHLIHSLCRQLGGTVVFGSCGLGLTCRLELPAGWESSPA